MTNKGFKFYNDMFKTLLESSPSIEAIKEKALEYRPLDSRLPLDQAFRDRLICLVVHPDLASNSQAASDVLSLVSSLLHCCVTCARQDLCSGTTPLQLFSILFNCVTIQRCEECFSILEDCIPEIKDPKIFTTGRNMLLRMCNDILRRLSKSQNTTFCGRIQLFLSRLFPLDERSGLNIVGRFNSDNVTPYSDHPDETALVGEDASQVDQEMETLTQEAAQFPLIEMLYKRKDAPVGHGTDQIERSEQIKVNGEMYVHFWSLQEFFRNPLLCYEASKWDKLSRCTEEVLTCFDRYKLDSRDVHVAAFKSDAHFTKYLTSERLLNLELMDSTFRRYILVQLLILFQYFTLSVRSRNEHLTLSESQESWLKAASERIKQHLIPESPPDGQAFAHIVEQILREEEFWSKWKNKLPPCPTFIHPPSNDPRDQFPPLERKRPVNTLVDRSGRRICRFTSAEMTALWNQDGTNLEMVKQPKHLFKYDRKDYFEDAILQLDPKEKTEERDKLTNSEEWSWRAFRLITRDDPNLVKLREQSDTSKVYLTKVLQKMGEQMGLLSPPPPVNQESAPPATSSSQTESEPAASTSLKRTLSSPNKESSKHIKLEDEDEEALHIVNVNDEAVAEQDEMELEPTTQTYASENGEQATNGATSGTSTPQLSRSTTSRRRSVRRRSRRTSTRRSSREVESSSTSNEEEEPSESGGEEPTSEMVQVLESA